LQGARSAATKNRIVEELSIFRIQPKQNCGWLTVTKGQRLSHSQKNTSLQDKIRLSMQTWPKLRILLLVCSVTISLAAQEPKVASNSGRELYERAMNALTGVPPSRNDITGIDLLRRSAEIGFSPAQTALGFINEDGVLVPRNFQEAASWYRKAALQGDRLAAWSLGRLYFVGSIPGSRRDGERWLTQAANAGDPFGAYLLALSIDELDHAAATKYLRQAAVQGLPFAQYKLALALRDGIGTPVNKTEAYVWFLLSLQAGVQNAAVAVQALEGELGTTKTEQGKSRARELQNTLTRSANAHSCTGWNGELSEIPTPPPLDIQRFCN
jgi:TPR repeat protein